VSGEKREGEKENLRQNETSKRPKDIKTASKVTKKLILLRLGFSAKPPRTIQRSLHSPSLSSQVKPKAVAVSDSLSIVFIISDVLSLFSFLCFSSSSIPSSQMRTFRRSFRLFNSARTFVSSHQSFSSFATRSSTTKKLLLAVSSFAVVASSAIPVSDVYRRIKEEARGAAQLTSDTSDLLESLLKPSLQPEVTDVDRIIRKWALPIDEDVESRRNVKKSFILRDFCYPVLDSAMRSPHFTLFVGGSATGKTTTMVTYANSSRCNPDTKKTIVPLVLRFKLGGPFLDKDAFVSEINEAVGLPGLAAVAVLCPLISAHVGLSVCRLNALSPDVGQIDESSHCSTEQKRQGS
jgi:hypothetical protein